MWQARKDSLGAMPRRVLRMTVLSVSSLVGTTHVLHGQTRDSIRVDERVYRVQVVRHDTTLVRALRLARQQLEGRLDSLQHEFEGLGLDSPDRADLVRELHKILTSLGSLSQLEQGGRARALAPEAPGFAEKRQFPGQMEVFAGPRISIAALQPGWIGINAEAPHERIVRNDSAYIRYFGYPEIVSVEPNSPAERVGIARGDQLIAYDGADLRDREINLTKLLQPSRRLTVTVRRDGEEHQFPVIVARPPARVMERLELTVPGLGDSVPGRSMVFRAGPMAPKIVMFDRMDPESAPVAGAKLTEIRNEDLGHIFGVARGVLVTEVFSDPARESGLHGGDVIVRADGQDLTSVAQLRRIVAARSADRTVDLEIVRQKKARPLTLHW
jgi:serine protease Do